MSTPIASRWTEPRLILIATSLSDHPALMYQAVSQARRCGARLLLTHVVPADDPGEKLNPEMTRILRTICIRNAHEQLEYTALKLQWQGILCDSAVLTGDRAEQIDILAREQRVDRVVVAVRDKVVSTTTAPLSLSEELVGRLTVPVCVVGRRIVPIPYRDQTFGRVLLPLSLRHDRPDYIRFASRLASESHARLTLLHVLPASPMSDFRREQAQTAARQRIAALLAAEPRLPGQPEIVIREGHAERAILEEAVCPHRDYIVLGSSSLSPRSRTTESLVHRIIAEARCPVITIKPLPIQDAVRAAEIHTMAAPPQAERREPVMASQEG